MSRLESELLAAHDAGDGASLAALYGQAGDQAPDTDAACFFWTQAYVFALEAGMEEAEHLRHLLKAHGREA